MPARSLRVYLDGTPLGTVEQSTQGALRLTYDHDYASNPDATPLSLSMPVTAPQGTGWRHRVAD